MGSNGRGHAKMRAERQTVHDFGSAEHGAHDSVGEEMVDVRTFAAGACD